MASEKVLRTNVSLWQKWLKSVKASQCNADGNFWKHLCNNVTVFQCNGVTFNQGWCTTGDKVTRVKSAKSDCTILNACHCMQMELVESLEGDELRDAVRLYNRACCREVNFSKTLAWVIFCCLFMCRIDIYLSWKKLIMFSWGEIGLKIWPVLKGKWLKIGLNWAYFKVDLFLIQKW